jgi:hypothetical protein
LPIGLVAAAVLITVPILLYRSDLIAGITAAVGSTTITLIVLAHLGVLAAVIAPFVAWRRRRHGRSS